MNCLQINSTYQLLRRKFSSVSRFLNDDRVKSRLLRDLKNFHDMKDSPEGKKVLHLKILTESCGRFPHFVGFEC